MAKTSMEIVMSSELKDRLHAVALKQGKTVQEFAQEALYTYVEDIEDGVMSDVALTEEGLKYYLTESEMPVALDHSVFEVSRKTA
jgi:predicted DNA-binding protein